MAKKKKAIKKVAARGRPRKAPALKVAPRLTPKPKPKFQPATRPDPIKLSTTSKTVAPAVQEPAWERVLGRWVREGELAKGCEWYDDGGNEGLKQRPIN